jgi:hypothetical protein
MTIRILFIAIGLISANYIFQMFAGRDWDIAFERSVFQSIALFTVWLSFTLQTPGG